MATGWLCETSGGSPQCMNVVPARGESLACNCVSWVIVGAMPASGRAPMWPDSGV